MSGIPAETLLLCLVCGVLLGFVFAVLELSLIHISEPTRRS